MIARAVPVGFFPGDGYGSRRRERPVGDSNLSVCLFVRVPSLGCL